MSGGVLFLDIDDVICTNRAHVAFEHDKHGGMIRAWDPIAIKLIDRLCIEYDLEVVVSSTWRHHFPVPVILKTHGFRGKFHKSEKTPSTTRGFGEDSRGNQIHEWITDNNHTGNILIIDDSTDGIAGSNLEKFQTVTEYYEGMMWKNYHEAKKILDKQVSGELKLDINNRWPDDWE